MKLDQKYEQSQLCHNGEALAETMRAVLLDHILSLLDLDENLCLHLSNIYHG